MFLHISRLSILLAVSFGSASGLLAQDFFGPGISAETAARAGIYVPGSGNALDALSMNPAGLASLTGPLVNLSALGMLGRGDFSNAANQNSPMRLTAGVVPYGAFGTSLGKRWSVGAGFMPDLLSLGKWQYRDAPGMAGADYGAQLEKSEIMALRTAAGVSYRVSSRVAVGATVGAIYNSNTLIAPYVLQTARALAGQKALLNLHTSGIGWNSSFGVIAEPARHWQLGAAFRTRSSITSNGNAAGNLGVQFAALQIPFQPSFAYHAQVKVEMPESALLSAVWQTSAVWRLSFQSTWTNWNHSFANLPISLTNGTNSDINSFLQSNTIKDLIPLNWKDQFSFAAAAERQLGETYSVSGGYRHQNNPVPSSTLSPLTAAIMGDGLTAGVGCHRGRARFDLAYQFNFAATQSVGTSGLLSGEFNNSRVRIGTQAVTLSTSFHL